MSLLARIQGHTDGRHLAVYLAAVALAEALSAVGAFK